MVSRVILTVDKTTVLHVWCFMYTKILGLFGPMFIDVIELFSAPRSGEEGFAAVQLPIPVSNDLSSTDIISCDMVVIHAN